MYAVVWLKHLKQLRTYKYNSLQLPAEKNTSGSKTIKTFHKNDDFGADYQLIKTYFRAVAWTILCYDLQKLLP